MYRMSSPTVSWHKFAFVTSDSLMRASVIFPVTNTVKTCWCISQTVSSILNHIVAHLPVVGVTFVVAASGNRSRRTERTEDENMEAAGDFCGRESGHSRTACPGRWVVADAERSITLSFLTLHGGGTANHVTKAATGIATESGHRC